MGLKKQLADAKNNYEYYRDNKSSLYNDVVSNRDSIIQDKQTTIARMRSDMALEIADHDTIIANAYSAYQTALTTGNNISIASALDFYNLKVQEKNDYVFNATDQISRTEYNFDVDIANAQEKIDNFEQDYSNKLNDYLVAYVNLDSEVTSLENELADMDAEVDQLKDDCDNILLDLKNKVKEAKDNCYWQYVEDYSDAIKDFEELVSAGKYELVQYGDDVNPAEVIYEILKNELWGCDYPDDRLDIYSLLKVAVKCMAEKLGISCLINTQSKSGDVINKILQHINGICFDNPTTGKLTFKLIRDDFDVGDLREFNSSNCIKLEFTRLDWSETADRVTATFTDSDNKYEDGTLTVYDIANTKITHNIKDVGIDSSFYTTPRNAYVYAKRTLLSSAYPLSAIEIECNRIGYNINLGDPILVSWPPYGIDSQVFRVTDIDYGTLLDGSIKISAIEDVFSFESTSYNNDSEIHWTEPEAYPESVSRYLAFEMPYELSREFSTFVNVYAASPTAETTLITLWRYLGSSYKKVSSTNNFSTVCRLQYALIKTFDIVSNIEIFVYGYHGRENIDRKIEKMQENPSDYTNRNYANLVCIDDEILSYSRIEKMPSGSYMLYDVRRGLMDTLPSSHIPESFVFFLEGGLDLGAGRATASEGSMSTESIGFTTSTQNREQSLDTSTTSTFSTTRRSEKPSVMDNLFFGADRDSYTIYHRSYSTMDILSGDLLFKFNTRNKFNDVSLYGPDDNHYNVDMDASIKYYLRFSLDNDMKEFLFDSVDQFGATLTSFTLKYSDLYDYFGADLTQKNNVTIEVGTFSLDRQLYSHSSYKESFTYTIPHIIGILSSVSDVQSYLDSLLNTDRLIVPVGTYNDTFAMSTDQFILVLVGNESITPTGYDLVNQDGKYFTSISNAFIVTRAVSGYAVEYMPIDILDGFILRDDFTYNSDLSPDYYKYRLNTNDWEKL